MDGNTAYIQMPLNVTNLSTPSFILIYRYCATLISRCYISACVQARGLFFRCLG